MFNLTSTKYDDSLVIKEPIFTLSKQVENRYYIDKVKNKISEYNNNYVISLINFILENPSYELPLEEFIRQVIDLSEKIDKNLEIKNTGELDYILGSVRISEILLESSVRRNDIDGILNSFYALDSDLDSYF